MSSPSLIRARNSTDTYTINVHGIDAPSFLLIAFKRTCVHVREYIILFLLSSPHRSTTWFHSYSAEIKKYNILLVSSCSHPPQWGDHWLLPLLCARGWWWGEQHFHAVHSSRHLHPERVHASHLLQLLHLCQ